MAENGSESDIGSQDNLSIASMRYTNTDIDELDDEEYEIPAVNKLPTLESILAEPDCGSLSGTDDDVLSTSADKLGGSGETASVGSLASLNSLTKSRNTQPPASGVILRHIILKGICAQIASASERINAGFASAVAAKGNMLVIGTSHGLILAFDSSQTLRWCDQEARHQGAVSALCFNNDGSRILAGFARGYILMIDTSNGKVLRTLTEVHAPGTTVLHVKFTDSPKVALCSDSGGSVFELSFTRIMGVRGCESKCIFSGSRGEVCTLEPLLFNDFPSHPLRNYTIVAMATLSKVIVVCIRPRMKVVLTHPLRGAAVAPPQVSWQLVVIQSANATRVVDPVLALGRDTEVYFYQVCTGAGSRINLSPLRRIVLTYMMSNLKWLNARSLVILDVHERLHLIDVRVADNLEVLDVSQVGISYASSHFKGLSTGGNVSKAMALAGERACYNTVITVGNQLLLLGTKSLHAICIRTWTERLRHLAMQGRFLEALALGLSFYQDKAKAVVGLHGSKQRRKQMARDKVCQVLVKYMDNLRPSSVDDDTLDPDMVVSTCVSYCVLLENTELLFGKLWDLVSESEDLKAIYLRSLEAPLLDGSLPPRLPPLVAQQFFTLYDQEDRTEALQAVVILLSVECLDIHQVTLVCRKRGLWEALIHLQKTSLGDFTAPIHQLMPVLRNSLPSSPYDAPSKDCVNLGNALLVYASCCLAGRDFPRGEIPESVSKKAKADILRALLSQHSSLANDSETQYPYLRTLLRFDAKGFLDVIVMAFQEAEFSSEIGLRQRQRLVDILLSIVLPSTPLAVQSPEYLTDEQRSLVLIFVVNEITQDTVVNLEPATLNKLVETLSNVPVDSEISKDHQNEKENAVLRLLHSRKLVNISDNTLIHFSQRANFLRVLELLYTSREDWQAVCRCMTADPARCHNVWPWLQRLPKITLHDVISKHILVLIKIDANQLASIIASRLPGEVNKMLDNLAAYSEALYALINALYYHLHQYKEENNKFELSTNVLETYLRLMCQMEPERVVSHLFGSHGCRLDEALRIVEAENHQDAKAVMLEKLGNYQEAFDLLLGRLKECLNAYCQTNLHDDEAVRIAIQLTGLCRRSAGSLDWMPLVETVLSTNLNSDNEKVKSLREKLLNVVLEALGGTTALSVVLEQILKHPLATGGTIKDIRRLLSGVLTQSHYEETLVETTAKLVSLDLHKALKKSLRYAGKAYTTVSVICPVCRQMLSQSSEYVAVFDCGHGYHLECLSEPKTCYKCLNSRDGKPAASGLFPSTPRVMERRRRYSPPAFMRDMNTAFRLAPPIAWPDLEGIF